MSYDHETLHVKHLTAEKITVESGGPKIEMMTSPTAAYLWVMQNGERMVSLQAEKGSCYLGLHSGLVNWAHDFCIIASKDGISVQMATGEKEGERVLEIVPLEKLIRAWRDSLYWNMPTAPPVTGKLPNSEA